MDIFNNIYNFTPGSRRNNIKITDQNKSQNKSMISEQNKSMISEQNRPIASEQNRPMTTEQNKSIISNATANFKCESCKNLETADRWKKSVSKPNCFTSKDQSKLNFIDCANCNDKIVDDCNKPICDIGNKKPCPILFCCYIKSLTPDAGPVTGETVTITGYNLSCIKFILFDTKKISVFTTIDNTTIRFKAPVYDNKYTVYVAVGNDNFISNNLCYTYVDSAMIKTIIPNFGPFYGQNIVTINGINLTTAVTVNFGKNKIFNFNIIDDQTIEIAAPALSGNDTIVNITVITLAGSSNSIQYTYIPPPII